jgi:rubrerythrin
MSELALFLAHAIALEEEAAERYAELADAMEVHNNKDVADLFRKLSHYSSLHLADVKKTAEGIELPKLKPWEYEWAATGGPESTAAEDTHYLMTPYHCIHLALKNERQGHDYYANAGKASPDAEVRKLALQFAEEESEHVATLEKWAANVKAPAADWAEDMDPPAEVE